MARGQTQWCDEARDHSPCSRSLPKAPLEAHQACLPVLRSATSSSPPAVVSPPIVYHVTYTQSVDVRPHTRPRGGGGERVMLHVARSQPFWELRAPARARHTTQVCLSLHFTI